MANIILQTNAIPVYGFLSVIHAQLSTQEGSQPGRVLDCGAGGPVPPLALFQAAGFEAWGIDTSGPQLELAEQFGRQQGIELHLRKGDMRQIPFEDEMFDFVYEQYSMCHLNKPDTALAIREMYRVLKPQGLVFLGFISTDCWPKSLFGEEKAPGEYWGEEGGETNVLHSMFSDEEADRLVSEWEILRKEKLVRYLREAATETSLEAWMDLIQEAEERPTQVAWQEEYLHRAAWFRYAHLYYFLRKPI